MEGGWGCAFSPVALFRVAAHACWYSRDERADCRCIHVCPLQLHSHPLQVQAVQVGHLAAPGAARMSGSGSGGRWAAAAALPLTQV